MRMKNLKSALTGFILLSLVACGTMSSADYGYPTKPPGVGTTNR